MEDKNRETIEAENVKVNNKADSEVIVDDRGWFEKMVDNHPKGFVTGCTITGALLGAGIVATLAAIFGGDADMSVDQDTAHTEPDGGVDVMS